LLTYTVTIRRLGKKVFLVQFVVLKNFLAHGSKQDRMCPQRIDVYSLTNRQPP
jgi:hypothetical protein